MAQDSIKLLCAVHVGPCARTTREGCLRGGEGRAGEKKKEGGVTSLTFPSSGSDWLLFEEAHGFFQLISASPSL